MPDRQESSTVNEITKGFEELRRRREELNQAFIRWITKRRHTKEQLEELATKLHEHHRNVNISTATGASMGTVGGILAIAGLIAAPFTFGAGFTVALVGAGIGGAGGLVMSGSKIAKKILSKVGVNAAEKAIVEDTDSCIALQQQLDELKSFISDLAVFIRLLHKDALILNLDYTTFSQERVDFGARFFRNIMSAASVKTGQVVRAAYLPLDIVVRVKSSLELHRGSTANAVEDIRKILHELECPDVNEIEELLERFINEKFAEAYIKIDGEEEQWLK